MGLGAVISKLRHLVGAYGIIHFDFILFHWSFRKDIDIEGRNQAVIRDVLVFTLASTENPDETDETVWTLRARVYFDLSSIGDEGFLNFQRLDGAFSTRVAISFGNETQVSGVSRDITLQIPVKLSFR